VTQQIGPPEELYTRPANLDVARFMGYRNIIAMTADRPDGGHVRLVGSGLRLQGVPQGGAGAGLAAAAIRPDDIELGGEGTNVIAGRAEIVEYCGRDYLVDMTTEGGLLLHVRSPRRVAPGDTLRCHVPPERVLVYPAEE
jgi:putative spermidine/putrescine transport system ATP-binding protein